MEMIGGLRESLCYFHHDKIKQNNTNVICLSVCFISSSSSTKISSFHSLLNDSLASLVALLLLPSHVSRFFSSHGISDLLLSLLQQYNWNLVSLFLARWHLLVIYFFKSAAASNRLRCVRCRSMESPPGCCKIIHWVRHAEGVHNVESRKNHDFLMSSSLFDSQLSPLGCQQVRDLRNHVRSSELLQKIDLVITSPLLRYSSFVSKETFKCSCFEDWCWRVIVYRTMQTAALAFGGDIISDASSHIQQKGSILMVANTGGTELPSVSSCSCPPFLAVELCRERLVWIRHHPNIVYATVWYEDTDL